MPVAAGEEVLRSRRGRGRAKRLRTAQKNPLRRSAIICPPPIPGGRGQAASRRYEELPRALEALGAAGLERWSPRDEQRFRLRHAAVAVRTRGGF